MKWTTWLHRRIIRRWVSLICLSGLALFEAAMATEALAQANGACYVDTACSAGNQRRVRNAGNGQCVDITTCSAVWKCPSGPTTGTCGGGSQDCEFSPGCGDAVQDCFNGFCTAVSTCRDRIKFQGRSFNPTANQCSCAGNPPAAGTACTIAGGICYLDTACSAGNQRRVRDAGNGQCVDITTCSAVWKCPSGPTNGTCGGGSQDCEFSPGCGDAVQDCFNGFCTAVSTCRDRIKFQGRSFNPTANQCSCAGNPPAAGTACAVASGICHLDTACSAGNQRRVRDAGNGQCVDVDTCTALWKCSSGPTTGICGGGIQDCAFSPGCSSDAQDCFNGFCAGLNTCSDRIRFQGYSSTPTLNQCSCAGNPPSGGGSCAGNSLTVTVAGSGLGTVSSSPAGISCGFDCSESYPFGTSVTLFATPAPGSVHAGWAGDPDCIDGSVVMTGNKSCIATFNSVQAGCTVSATQLCLANDRFRVAAQWTNSVGNSGSGQAVKLTGDTGYFWFFNSANVEMVVKVLNACSFGTPRFWVFAGGLTDVEVRLTVTDTLTGSSRTYINPMGVPFAPIQDTGAFATCN